MTRLSWTFEGRRLYKSWTGVKGLALAMLTLEAWPWDCVLEWMELCQLRTISNDLCLEEILPAHDSCSIAGRFSASPTKSNSTSISDFKKYESRD